MKTFHSDDLISTMYSLVIKYRIHLAARCNWCWKNFKAILLQAHASLVIVRSAFTYNVARSFYAHSPFAHNASDIKADEHVSQQRN